MFWELHRNYGEWKGYFYLESPLLEIARADLPIVELDGAFGDGQSEPHSAGTAFARCIDPIEWLENLV
jgi:hypothetical protein